MVVKWPGFALTVSLKPRSSGAGGEHGTGGEGGRVDPAGHPVRALEGLLVGLDVERGPADHLEGDQMRVHGVGVAGHVDVDPVLHGADLRGLGRRSLVEVHTVQVQEPGRFVRCRSR